MAAPLAADAGSVPLLPRHQLVLVDGRTFAISSDDGDMSEPTHGLVHDDLRHLSRLAVRFAEGPLEVLASAAATPLSAVIVGRVRGEGPQQVGVVTIRRWIAGGLRQDVRVQNPTNVGQRWTMRVELAADFAHVFAVKAGEHGRERQLAPSGARWVIRGDDEVATEVRTEPRARMDVGSGALEWQLVIPPRGESNVRVTCEPIVDGVAAGLAFPCEVRPTDALPVVRLEQWQADVPTVTSDDPRLSMVVDRAMADLAALRIFDRAHPERVVIAAGAPWFMTLFGRDSLLASWMLLPFEPRLAVGVLRALAELQGTVDDPRSEEQPGKILHELRRHGGGGPFSSRERYYGTVDATPLFVMLAAEAWRWGALSPSDLEALSPAIDRAVTWLSTDGDSDGDGFVDYQRRNDNGLANQGWKDSWDGITSADGTIAGSPIALVEVQGYTYAALLGAASLAAPMQLTRPSAECVARAEDLRARFDEAYWSSAGWYALALDGSGKQVDALTTNPGHALWTGIADPGHADRYLDTLMGSEMWSGWGLRTLGCSMGAYDPLSYHNGSVWPHDTAICAAGAARYGRWDVVDRIIDGALDAAVHFQGRPPELFSGLSRDDSPVPVPYPSSCSPQAWASASVLLLARSLLGLDVDTRGELQISRTDLKPVPNTQITGVHAAGARHRVQVHQGMAQITSA